MKIEEYDIDKEYVLRDWLKKRFSRRRILSLKGKGRMTVDGVEIRADQKIYEGQRLRLEFSEDKPRDFEPCDLGLKVLYADEDITVVYKGRGIVAMPTQRKPTGSVLNGMKFLFPDKTYRVVTRLDKDTEGLVLLANNALSHSRIKKIDKFYIAVVRGSLRERITVDAPIERGEGIKRKIGGSARCLSVISPLWTGNKYSLALMQPVTGRTHQLRLHSAYAGFTIAGDTLYGEGAGEYNSGQMLACVRLDIVHPSTNQVITVSAEEVRDRYLDFAKSMENC